MNQKIHDLLTAEVEDDINELKRTYEDKVAFAEVLNSIEGSGYVAEDDLDDALKSVLFWTVAPAAVTGLEDDITVHKEPVYVKQGEHGNTFGFFDINGDKIHETSESAELWRDYITA